MYPYDVIFGFDLYEIFMLVGLLAAIVVFDRYVSRRKIPSKVQNFYLILGVVSIIVGIYSAELVQSVFNYFKTGVFKLEGMTFYGGVIGGVVVFLVGLFAVGAFIFKDGEHLKYFNNVYEVAPCCITIAHGFGRLGCLMAGCCYGKESDVFGLRMHVFYGGEYVTGKFLPTQLYEAIFLFILFGVLSYLYKKDKKVNFIVYLISYGLWRFAIEFLRADDRGAFIPGLSPAQAISILFILVGIGMITYRFIKKRQT